MLARCFLLAAAFTSTWTGVQVAAFKPVDLFLVAALITGALTIFTAPAGLPRWVWIGAAGIILTLAIETVLPAEVGQTTIGSETPWVAAAQWLVALAVLPFLVVNLYPKVGQSVEPLMTAWVLGAAVSGLAALTDYLGFTGFNVLLHGVVPLGGRQFGLATHPVHLGLASAIAAPMAVYILGQRRWVIGGGSAVLLAAGVLTSGSRGAQVGLVVALIASLFLVRGSRRLVPVLTYAAGWTVAVGVLFRIDLVESFSQVLRFENETSAVASNTIRLQLAEQAAGHILANPFFGVGFSGLVAAHSIYLQVLTTGGILLLVAMVVYWVGALRDARRLAREGAPIAAYLACSIFAWLVMGLVENQLTDRYLYFPVAAVVALTAVRLEGTRTRTRARGPLGADSDGPDAQVDIDPPIGSDDGEGRRQTEAGF